MNKKDLVIENEELKIENSRLWNKINNETITLPSGKELKLSNLNMEQLEYLESLSNENINRM